MTSLGVSHAAALLELTRGGVHHLVRRGMLRPQSRLLNRQLVFELSDVLDLKMRRQRAADARQRGRPRPTPGTARPEGTNAPSST